MEREILNGNIKEKRSLFKQATLSIKSDVMEIFDTIPKDEFEEYMAKSFFK